MKKPNPLEEIKFLKLALGMQGIGVTIALADQILRTYKEILEKGEDFTLKDAVKIELDMELKYKLPQEQSKENHG